MIGTYSESELAALGFKKWGKDIKISKTATIYNTGSIELGDHVRIDNFCVIAPSGQAQLKIGSHVHISAFNFINGMGDISIGDHSTTAPYVGLFSSTDDYSGATLTGATIPKEFLGTRSATVSIKPYCIVGAGTMIMPGVTLEEGTAVGAHSFVNASSQPFTIIGGVPATYLKDRKHDMIELAKKINS